MDALLDNRASQLSACLGSCGKILSYYLWDPGAMNATVRLKFARNAYLGSKTIWLHNQ